MRDTGNSSSTVWVLDSNVSFFTTDTKVGAGAGTATTLLGIDAAERLDDEDVAVAAVPPVALGSTVTARVDARLVFVTTNQCNR